MIKKIKIGNKYIGEKYPVFIIAEAGVNHNGKLSLALRLVDAAKKAGADAVKFQTFVVEEGTPKFLEKADYQKRNTSAVESMYEMLKKLEFGLKEFKKLKNYCQQKNIIFLSTPCDFKSLKILDEVGVEAFKIGSGDLTFLPLIKEAAKRNKPLIVSTGMAKMAEIKEAVKTIEKTGNKKIAILQCTTDYPSRLQNINLNVLCTFQNTFNYPIGFSDHTMGIESAIAAVALGAKVIEKHLTLNKKMQGPDHRASLEPSKFAAMIKSIRNVESAMGSSVKKPTKTEIEIAKKIRKSVVATRNLRKGEILNKTNTKIMKPEGGIPPKYWEKIIGKILKNDKQPFQHIYWKDIL